MRTCGRADNADNADNADADIFEEGGDSRANIEEILEHKRIGGIM